MAAFDAALAAVAAEAAAPDGRLQRRWRRGRGGREGRHAGAFCSAGVSRHRHSQAGCSCTAFLCPPGVAGHARRAAAARVSQSGRRGRAPRGGRQTGGGRSGGSSSSRGGSVRGEARRGRGGRGGCCRPRPHGDVAAEDHLSDLDDDEAAAYLHPPAEVALRARIWDELNRDYIEAQAAKAAAAAAAAAAAERAAGGGTPPVLVKPPPPASDDEGGAHAADTTAGDAPAADDDVAPAPPRAKRPRGRPLGSKTRARPEDALPPAGSSEEAARRMLAARKLSSKINYAVLADLFREDGGDGGDGDSDAPATLFTAADRDRLLMPPPPPRPPAGVVSVPAGGVPASPGARLAGLAAPLPRAGELRSTREA